MNRDNILLLIWLFPFLALGCCRETTGRQAGVSFTDRLGRQVIVDSLPRRIVSFAPNLTEMVYALNGQDKLVGVTSWCNYPPQAKDKPSVGDYLHPNWERLVWLRPDLVLLVAQDKSNILAKLSSLNINAVAFRSETAKDIFAEIDLLGQILDRQRQADSLNHALMDRLDSIRRRVAEIPPDSRPRVFAEISAQPLMSGSHQSFLGQLIQLAGGVNIAGDLGQPYAPINPESVIRSQPDVILILHPQALPQDVKRRWGWSHLPAVKKGRVHSELDLDLLMRPGPRFVEAVEALHKIIYEKP